MDAAIAIIFALLFLLLLLVHLGILTVLFLIYRAYIRGSKKRSLRLTKKIIIHELKKGK